MFVYQITNQINGKRYIGITTQSLRKRWNQHVSSLNCGVAPAIKKYGAQNFTIEVIAEAGSIEEMKLLEIILIEKLKPEYNRSAGGEGTHGYKHSDEARAKMKAYAKIRVPAGLGSVRSKEQREMFTRAQKYFYTTPEGDLKKHKIRETLKNKGFRPPPNIHTAGTKWWTNGQVNKRSKECPGNDYRNGRTIL